MDDRDELIIDLFSLREKLLKKFEGKSRRRWYDPEDAFSDVITDLLIQARAGELDPPPHGWFAFFKLEMRQKIWQVRRRNKEAEALASAVIDAQKSKKVDDPSGAIDLRDQLDAIMPDLKKMLSPQEQAVFFANAQKLGGAEVARIAGTSPGSARVAVARAKKKLKKWREGLPAA